MGRKPANRNVAFRRDPDLPGVEVRFSSYNEEAFRKHTHAALSVGLILTGRTTFFLEGEDHVVEAGQIALIPAEAVHVCRPDLDSNMTYRMFYIHMGRVMEVVRELDGPGAKAPIFPTPVVDDPELFRLWLGLHRAILSEGADGEEADMEEGRAMDDLEKETLLLQGLAGLVTRHANHGGARRREQEGAGEPEAVRLVREHLTAHAGERVTLDELSGVAGMSRYHLLRVFQEETGLPPHAFQNQLRVDRGKEMLARGQAISQVAAELGFADQSHFTRIFRQFTGATPSQYQSGSEESS